MIDLIVILCSVRPAPVQPGNTGDHGKCGTQPPGTSEVFGYLVSADSLCHCLAAVANIFTTVQKCTFHVPYSTLELDFKSFNGNNHLMDGSKLQKYFNLY